MPAVSPAWGLLQCSPFTPPSRGESFSVHQHEEDYGDENADQDDVHDSSLTLARIFGSAF